MASAETGYFGELLLSAPVARALREMGYREPTPIQREAIPPFLAGKDVSFQPLNLPREPWSSMVLSLKLENYPSPLCSPFEMA